MKYRCLLTTIVVFNLTFSTFSNARDNVNCRGHNQGFGPFDYSNPYQANYKKNLKLVEDYHFTRNVELLIKPETALIVEGDLDYTLRAWPNHHRALFSMAKSLRSRPPNFAESEGLYTARCYFENAIRYKPNDFMVWMLYGMHYHVLKDHKQAEEKYKRSIAINNDNAEVHYNYGLLLLDMGKIEQAEESAQLAEKLGYPLSGLREKIRKKRRRK